MKLFQLLNGIDYVLLAGKLDVEIDSIAWDSRMVEKNSVFIAVKSRNVDRHDFVLDALDKGAIAVVVERNPEQVPSNVTVLRVKDSRKAMAQIANNFYDNPSEKLKLIGVTGTNGKTSVTYFTSELLETLSAKCGIIGTIENTVDGEKLKTRKLNPTTPDALELQSSLSEMVRCGATHAAIEVTSSALSWDRVHACKFEIGVFTNLTQDHLDEHGTMENYKNAKMKLFDMCKKAAINGDDEVSKDILARGNCEILTYGIDTPCDFRAVDINYSESEVKFKLLFEGSKREVELNIPGKFSVYNALSAITCCYLLGYDLDLIISGVKAIRSVPGRFQTIPNPKGILSIVDYAHSPDGLENILTSVRGITKGKIILVFGCGGNRDRSKRPIMGEIAGKYSNYCFITSDNPRKEQPIEIIRDIEKGINKTLCRYEKVQSRSRAIYKALDIAEAGDTVIIAGKGHEDYQILGDQTIHFSDEEIVKEYFMNN